MTQIPNPAELAGQRKAAAERDRVKTARKRRRAQSGAPLKAHLDPELMAALAKLAHPEASGR